MGKDSVGCDGWVQIGKLRKDNGCIARMGEIYGGERKVWYLCRRKRKSGTLKLLHVPVLKVKFKGGDFKVDFRRQFSGEN